MKDLISADLTSLVNRKPSGSAFSPSSEELTESFRELALLTAAYGRSIDVEIVPFASADLPIFRSLPLAEQQEAVMRLAQYVSICQAVITSGVSLRSSRTFVWRAFREIGIVPDSDMFNMIADDDIVEVYNLENIQVFRNFAFFKYCSYTLEQLFSRPWHELFVREDAAITDRILRLITKLVASGSRKCVDTNIGPQVIREVDSRRNLRNVLEVKKLGVLYATGSDSPVGFIGIEEAKTI